MRYRNNVVTFFYRYITCSASATFPVLRILSARICPSFVIAVRIALIKSWNIMETHRHWSAVIWKGKLTAAGVSLGQLSSLP